MDKQALRSRVWDELEERGEARFPFPPHGRIPNFAGADTAAENLRSLDGWKDAEVIKSNPDAPQLPVRRAALRDGKTVYMAVPRLRDERCFLELDPEVIEDIDKATTVSGSSEMGVQVHPREMPPIDLIVSGSVAVNSRGARIGKGEGYSDLEFAILRAFGLVGAETPVVTTVHDSQLVEEDIETSDYDVFLDWIITPTRTIETTSFPAKPAGIQWDALDEEQLEKIPILEQLSPF